MNPIFSTYKNKTGNLIVYMVSRINNLEHKKLTKLLYLVDEYAIKDGGIPITWLEYKAWRFGPVATEIFDIKDTEKNIFSEYVSVKKSADNTNILISLVEFDESEFSKYDMEIIDEVIETFGTKSFKELVDVTHKDGSPWDIAIKENNVPPETDTDHVLDLSQLIKNDSEKLAIYQEAEEIAWFRSQIKAS